MSNLLRSPLDQRCPVGLSARVEGFSICAARMVVTRHTWLSSMFSVASAVEEL